MIILLATFKFSPIQSCIHLYRNILNRVPQIKSIAIRTLTYSQSRAHGLDAGASSRSTQHVRMCIHARARGRGSQVALHGSATAEIRYMRLAPAFSVSARYETKKRAMEQDSRAAKVGKYRRRNSGSARVDPRSKQHSKRSLNWIWIREQSLLYNILLTANFFVSNRVILF